MAGRRGQAKSQPWQEVIKESIAIGRLIEVLKLDAIMNDHLVPRGMVRFPEFSAAPIHPELSEFSPLQRYLKIS